MKVCRYPITELLPHRPPMILLDAVSAYDEGSLVAAVTITASSLFLAGGSVPSHVALEYMAQACGAHVGILALERGDPVRIGFMLGTRDFVSFVPGFAIGETLSVIATLVFNEGQMGAFDCRVDIGHRLAAKARLSVYRPEPGELPAASETAAP
jgi:predicted hotdog family 3-hydroxylacyl-ACP dehydratase